MRYRRLHVYTLLPNLVHLLSINTIDLHRPKPVLSSEAGGIDNDVCRDPFSRLRDDCVVRDLDHIILDQVDIVGMQALEVLVRVYAATAANQVIWA